MGFDLAKFAKTAWEPRTADVKLPALSAFFDDGEDPVFKVRSLDGRELARMREEGERQKAFATLANKFASGQLKDVADAAVEALGDDTPDEIHRYLYAVETGILEPKLDRGAVIILMRHQHGAFMALANKILTLSGEGSVPGESKGSGRTRASKPT